MIPRVFISYSHDSDEHKERVRWLADKLCHNGVDCYVDQYLMSPPSGWQLWMREQVKKADFVVMVCTETYYRRFHGEEDEGRGYGVTWEGAIITQELYKAHLRTTKFVPVVFSPDAHEHVPDIARKWTCIELSVEAHYERLHRFLTSQPEVVKPTLGKELVLRERKPKQAFVAARTAGGGGRWLAEPSEPECEPPENLLSNRLDRGPQERKFMAAVEEHHRTRPHSPLVCVIHGAESECPSRFLTRLKEDALPEVCEKRGLGTAEEPPIESVPMALSLEKMTDESYSNDLRDDLKAAFGLYGEEGDEEVREVVVGKKMVVMIHVSLATEEWGAVDLRKFDQFLEFWDGKIWRDLPENFLLLICLFFTYRQPEGGRWKTLKPNRKMRKYIEDLSPGKYEGIYLVPIEELRAVTESDAKRLVDDKHITPFYKFNYWDIEKPFGKRKLRASKKGVPFESLFKYLSGLSKQRRTRAERGQA